MSDRKERAREVLEELLTMATPSEIMEMVRDREVRTGPSAGKQVMPKAKGERFRCECGGMVFTEVRDGVLRCNGCKREYEGK